MTKVRITGPGIWSGYRGKFQELPIGAEVEVSRVPLGWKSRCVVIGDETGKTPVTNKSDEDDPLDALRAEAVAKGVKVDKRWGEDRLLEEIKKAE